jgi:predicted enzyme related to lactoylglutathione lyase
MITGVAGVIIWTDDLARLAAFYRDTLGLTPHSVRPHFIAFKWGEMRLSLGRHRQVAGPARDPYRIMINLAVDDIHHTHAALLAKGVRFLRHPEQEHWGGWVATFLDPDGNILQLLQQPAG